MQIRRGYECLVAVLLWLVARQERQHDSINGGKILMVFGELSIVTWSANPLEGWSLFIMASASKVSSSLQAPAASDYASDFSANPHLSVYTFQAPIPQPTVTLPAPVSPSPKQDTLNPLLFQSDSVQAAPLPVAIPSLLPPASSPLLLVGASSTRLYASPLSSPDVSIPSLDPTVDTSEAPWTSPSSGCCAANMIPRPGMPFDSCVCVYPIKLELLVDNVSTNFTNWSSEFQQELAAQLHVKVIQIQITSFQFHGSNLSMVILIGPVTNNSFSSDQAEKIKTELDHLQVHFNNTLFGTYTLLRFQFFEPPSRDPFQTPKAGLPPLPILNVPTRGASIGHKQGHIWSTWSILAMVVATVIVILLILLLVWKFLVFCSVQEKRCRYIFRGISKATSSNFDSRLDAIGSIPLITTRLFTSDELKHATNNFAVESLLGEGGFGRVYRGVLKDGTAVAIKKLSGSSQGDNEFLVEVEMLSRLHHRNLVKLIGYYTNGEASQHLLCYELIPNGSLESWLHGPLGTNQPLEWHARITIALDAARGLVYLHEDCRPCVIHRDFKASNILIENNFHAKVADFGLAKQAPEGQANYVATRVMGTFGYVAPEYAMTGHLLVKSDVYSYGVVLLELLTGRKPVDMSQPPGQENLVTWARPMLKDKERLWELADTRLHGNYPKEDFAQIAAIAAACVAPEPSQRPTMGEVVQSLKMVQCSSYHSTSSERTTSLDITHHATTLHRSLSSGTPQMQANAAVESEGSSSVFSSDPFSHRSHDNDALQKMVVFSEDLHEGR